MKPSTVLFRLSAPAILALETACGGGSIRPYVIESPNCSLPEGPSSVTSIVVPDENKGFTLGDRSFYEDDGGSWIASETHRTTDEDGYVIDWEYTDQQPLIQNEPFIFEEEYLENRVVLRKNQEGIYFEVTRRCKER